MADNRELGLVALKERIKLRKAELNNPTFRRTPAETITVVPLLIMVEDVDEIIKYNQRDQLGYPAVRLLEIILELAVNESLMAIRPLTRKLREICFTGGPQIVTGVTIRELRQVGPFGYGVPDILGMRLILGMTYTDNGI